MRYTNRNRIYCYSSGPSTTNLLPTDKMIIFARCSTPAPRLLRSHISRARVCHRHVDIKGSIGRPCSVCRPPKLQRNFRGFAFKIKAIIGYRIGFIFGCFGGKASRIRTGIMKRRIWLARLMSLGCSLVHHSCLWVFSQGVRRLDGSSESSMFFFLCGFEWLNLCI